MTKVALGLGGLIAVQLGGILTTMLFEAIERGRAGSGQVEYSCTADNSGMDCSFTNQYDDKAPAVCVNGTIARKGAAGAQVKSQPVCSGALAPRTSYNGSGKWDGAMAKDLCFQENAALGIKTLDWEQCDFVVAKLP